MVSLVPSLRTLSCSISDGAVIWRERPLLNAKSSVKVVVWVSGSSRMAEPFTWPRPESSGGGS